MISVTAEKVRTVIVVLTAFSVMPSAALATSGFVDLVHQRDRALSRVGALERQLRTRPTPRVTVTAKPAPAAVQSPRPSPSPSPSPSSTSSLTVVALPAQTGEGALAASPTGSPPPAASPRHPRPPSCSGGRLVQVSVPLGVVPCNAVVIGGGK